MAARLVACAMLLAVAAAQPVALASWNFDASTTAVTGGTVTAPLPTITKTLSTLVESFPSGLPTTGKAYSLATFPTSVASNVTAGFLICVSTAGYTPTLLDFSIYHSATG